MSDNWMLEQYKHIFGEIIFPTTENMPDDIKNDIVLLKREIACNPNGWMYSYDGISWESVPMDIGKISFNYALLRKIPDGITIGVNNDIKKHPEFYMYSTDNGKTWKNLIEDDFPSAHTWLYHGDHNATWFKKHSI